MIGNEAPRVEAERHLGAAAIKLMMGCRFGEGTSEHQGIALTGLLGRGRTIAQIGQQRIEALPSITSSPPWPVAPADCEASPRTRTVPDIMFSATPGPAEPSIRTVARLFMPAL